MEAVSAEAAFFIAGCGGSSNDCRKIQDIR